MMSINRVSLYHLETLLWIDRLGTFSAAAERLNTTQPTVSARMRELEQRLGTALFRREGRAMSLTGITIEGASAHVAGAGGVSAGICCALAEAGIGRIAIANRNRERAVQLTARLRAAFPATVFAVTGGAPGEEIDIVVNATSLGLSQDDPLPVDLTAVRRGAFVGDVVNVPRQTAFLESADARGCRTQHGKAMFGPQIELALSFYANGL